MKIKIKITGGTIDEQEFARDELNLALIMMRRKQKRDGKPKAEYKIKAACRGVRSAGYKG